MTIVNFFGSLCAKYNGVCIKNLVRNELPTLIETYHHVSHVFCDLNTSNTTQLVETMILVSMQHFFHACTCHGYYKKGWGGGKNP